jgi:small subunit ribosomal protein S18
MSNLDDSHDGNDGDGGSRVRNDDPLGLRRRRTGKKRAPSFTMEPGFKFDHKDAQQLRYFLTDRGKIVPRRVSGLSAKQQRALTRAIQRARNLGLLPYTVKG